MGKHYERLKRLRDKLEDMEGKWKPFGFGILRPSPAAEVSLGTWERAEDACEPHFDRRDERLSRPRYWLDMTPDGTYCIQWWGDNEGVEAFKKWAEDAQVALCQSSAPTPEQFVPPVRPVSHTWDFRFEPWPWKPPSGYYWTLNAFAMLAIQNPHITCTNERVVLTVDAKTRTDVIVIPTRQRSLSDDDSHDDASVKISYLEIEEDAITLGLRALEQQYPVIEEPLPVIEERLPLLEEPIAIEIPLLYVENNIIFLKGKAVAGVDGVHAQHVDILVKANGAWVPGKDITDSLGWPEDPHIGRNVFKKLPPEVRNLIESERGKGFRIKQLPVANVTPATMEGPS